MLLLPKAEQKVYFDLIRKKAIHNENIKLLKETPQMPNHQLLVERSHGKSQLQMCSTCLGFYQRSNMWHHKLHCESSGTGVFAIGIPLAHVNAPSISDEFTRTILKRFRSDEAGKICQSDEMIKIVGKVIFERSSRRDGRSTMGEMRKLGVLLLSCRRLSCDNQMSGHDDLLDPKDFRLVINAMNVLTADEEGGI